MANHLLLISSLVKHTLSHLSSFSTRSKITKSHTIKLQKIILRLVFTRPAPRIMERVCVCVDLGEVLTFVTGPGGPLELSYAQMSLVSKSKVGRNPPSHIITSEFGLESSIIERYVLSPDWENLKYRQIGLASRK